MLTHIKLIYILICKPDFSTIYQNYSLPVANKEVIQSPFSSKNDRIRAIDGEKGYPIADDTEY